MSQLEPSTIGWLDSLGKVTPSHPDYADTDTTGAAPTSGNTTTGRIIQPSTLCRLCGIPHNRHTFAVNNFRSWFAQGQDIGALLPILQTYMGHSSLRDTSYYLRLTAESYPDINARVEQATGDVVPSVGAGPGHGH